MIVFVVLFSGIFSCLIMDGWQQILRLVFGLPSSNWGVVGRWSMYVCTSGKVYHPSIDLTDSIKNEVLVGWIVHYLVALMYAISFWFLVEYFHILSRTILDGLIFGAISVAIPWIFFMPCLGKGFFASQTPNPILACSLALVSHSVLGVALAISFSFFT